MHPILDAGKKILTLSSRIDRVEEDLENLRSELRSLSDEVGRLATSLREISIRQNYEREMVSKDWENLLLRLDAKLNEFDRRLPPAP